MANKTFSGGYHFKRFEGQPENRLLSLDIPPKTVIPIFQGTDSAFELNVRIGDTVYAGQIIAQNKGISSPVLSSVNGHVAGVEKRKIFNREATAVTIESDGTSGFRIIEGSTAQWEGLSAEKIEDLLYRSGTASCGREGIPNRFTSSTIKPEVVRDVIIYGESTDIFNASLDLLLNEEHAPKFIDGLRILKKIMPRAAMHLAVSREQQGVIDTLSGVASKLEGCSCHPVAAKYPQGCTEMLLPAVLSRDLPGGNTAADIGVVILDIQDVLHVFEAVVEGKPLIERIIALSGSGFTENLHLKVRIGTPVECIVADRIKKAGGYRLILNSLMTGTRLPDISVPVDHTFFNIIALPEGNTRQFLAFIAPGFKKDSYSRTFLSSVLPIIKKCDTNLHGEQRPCVFCNFCRDVCPALIIPHLLYRYVERDTIDETLVNLKIKACINCNLCSYVCPSKIPVADYIRKGIEELMMQGIIT